MKEKQVWLLIIGLLVAVALIAPNAYPMRSIPITELQYGWKYEVIEHGNGVFTFRAYVPEKLPPGDGYWALYWYVRPEWSLSPIDEMTVFSVSHASSERWYEITYDASEYRERDYDKELKEWIYREPPTVRTRLHAMWMISGLAIWRGEYTIWLSWEEETTAKPGEPAPIEIPEAIEALPWTNIIVFAVIVIIAVIALGFLGGKR